MKCCNHVFTGTLWKKCVKLVQNLNNILVGLTFGLTAICQGESVKLCKFTTLTTKPPKFINVVQIRIHRTN